MKKQSDRHITNLKWRIRIIIAIVTMTISVSYESVDLLLNFIVDVCHKKLRETNFNKINKKISYLYHDIFWRQWILLYSIKDNKLFVPDVKLTIFLNFQSTLISRCESLKWESCITLAQPLSVITTITLLLFILIRLSCCGRDFI